MADKAKQGGKKNRKIGRANRRGSHKQYTSMHRREQNKLKRVRQSNGLVAARIYAIQHNMKEPHA